MREYSVVILIPIKKKIVWDEAVSPFSCLPVSDLIISFPKGFAKIFSAKKFGASVASDQLMVGLPSLSEDLLSRDLADRQHVLDLWKSVRALSIIPDSDMASSLGRAVNAVSKGLLRPLIVATNLFRTLAYWHVPNQKSFRKFLGFCIERKKFQFLAIPFDLNVDPLIFTRLTKSILKELRPKGVQVLVYLDN